MPHFPRHWAQHTRQLLAVGERGNGSSLGDITRCVSRRGAFDLPPETLKLFSKHCALPFKRLQFFARLAHRSKNKQAAASRSRNDPGMPPSQLGRRWPADKVDYASAAISLQLKKHAARGRLNHVETAIALHGMAKLGVYPLYIRNERGYMMVHGTETPHHDAVLSPLS
jgi:hypothetical protein